MNRLYTKEYSPFLRFWRIRKGPYERELPIRILFILLLLLAYSPVAGASAHSAAAPPDRKFNFLLRFYDMNEAAFAYHRHCLAETQKINQVFLNNLEFVADALFDQAQIDDPHMSPKYIKDKILERRYHIQYRLDNDNMKNGCDTPATMAAKEHYEQLSRYSQAELSQFIDSQTRVKPPAK